MTENAKELLEDLRTLTNKVLLDLVAENEDLEEQLENKGDLISRAEVLKHREIMRDNHGTGYQAVKTKYIRELSSVENKGEWIPKHSTTDDWDVDLVCSRCDYVGIEGYAHGYELNEINMQEVRNYAKKLDMNFCPCCGADMRGESE